MDDLLGAFLREDLCSFVAKTFDTVSPGETYLRNWHIEAIVHQLMQVRKGESLRLLINQPPRSLKSICVSVGYVAWLLGHDPSRRVIVVSYSADFAAELHRQFRSVVSSDWYKACFPAMRLMKETGSEIVTSHGGGRYATSVGGTLTGRGADLIIVDDPLNAGEAQSEAARRRVIDWYGGALVSRLNDKNTGAIIVVMQRLHEDDLAGHLLRQGGWSHLNLPAIATESSSVDIGYGGQHMWRAGEALHPDRESLDRLDAIKRDVGSLQFSAQYQQQPVPTEGNIIKREWFRRYDEAPVSAWGRKTVQSWDIATATGGHNDYSVCSTWRTEKEDVYLLDVFRGRLEYPALRRTVIELATRHRPDTIIIEDAGPGMNLLQDLRSSPSPGVVYPIGLKPEGSKLDRMVTQSAKIEAGHVLLPKTAPWLGDFLHEMLSFPNGRHDDQVDSVSQFLRWWQQQNQFKIPMMSGCIVTRDRQFPW